MLRSICLVIGFFISSMVPYALAAAEVPRALVLPFQMDDVADSPQVQAKIAGMLKRNLNLEGIEVLPSADVNATDLSVDEVRKIGRAAEADYTLWGKVSRDNTLYFLEIKTVQTSDGGKDPVSFLHRAADMDTLYAGIPKLSGDIAAALLDRIKVLDVIIKGNVRIEAEVVKRRIKTTPGDAYSEKQLADDLKSIYAMGYFDDVKITAEDKPDGKVVIFEVKERPTVRNINLKIGKVINEEKLRENLTISTGSILNTLKLQNNIKIIETLYKEKKYYNVKVTYEIEKLENNQADLTFVIHEGEKIKIRKINIEGNSAFSDKALKKIIKTSEKGFFSWITSSGEYNPEQLSQDAERINDHYLNNGYIESRASDPVVVFEKESIFVTFKIFEGEQFKMGKVGITGDMIFPEAELMEKLKITDEEVFSRRKVQEDVLTLNETYANEGYAYPEISPLISPDKENRIVNLTFNIDKGKEIYFQKINITGNTRTRDKVIRRELKVSEQDKYSGKNLKRSVKNLHRLDYFEDVKVDQTKGTEEDRMVLDLQVVEKSTGTLSFGAGYSSVENLYGMMSITERNLFGRGQSVQVKAELGGVTTKFDVSFTEPWLFDIPLSASTNIYNWKIAYDDYDKDGRGGSVSFGYPVYDFTRVYFSYAYDHSIIKNISFFAANEIKELEGTNITSSVSSTLRYDSRDKVFNATEGSKHSVSVEYAGLAGNIGFIKYLAETGWYFPIYREFILFLHGRTGYLHQNSGYTLPDYEKFYLGGINSVRGFGWQGIHSLNDEGFEIGGDKFVQGNIELNLPIIKGAGLMGVLFYDTGDVYKRMEDFDLGDLNQSVGGGFRWYSPMGPMRIEYGYILNPKPGGESGGRWEFSVGGAF